MVLKQELREDFLTDFIGRLSKLKRPDIFVEICAETGMPGLILGQGELREAIVECIDWLKNEYSLLEYAEDYETDL